MRHLLLSLLFVFLAAPALSATDVDPVEATDAEAVPTVVAEVEPSAEADLHLSEISLEERPAADDAAAAQLGPRGSFWWLVGVVVVAGVILAVIL